MIVPDHVDVAELWGFCGACRGPSHGVEDPPRRAGFTIPMATHANWLLDSYVHGFALQEASLLFDTADAFAERVEGFYLPQVPPDKFPYLYESAAALVAAGFDPAEQFIFGLDLVLAALERLTASA